MTATTKTLGVAMGLLGGPIGAITTLLGLGLLAWSNWGNAAEEAADKTEKAFARAQRARDGLSTAEDVKTGKEAVAQTSTDMVKYRDDADFARERIKTRADHGAVDAKADAADLRAAKAADAKADAAEKMLKQERVSLALSEKTVEEYEKKKKLVVEENQAKAESDAKNKAISDRELVEKDARRIAYDTRAKNDKSNAYINSKEGKAEHKWLNEFKTTSEKAAIAELEKKNKDQGKTPDGKGGFAPLTDDAKVKREFQDPYQKAMAIAEGKNEISALKLKSATTGESTFREQAEAEFKAQWSAGNFDLGGEAKNRQFLKKGAKKHNSKDGYSTEELDVHSQTRITHGGVKKTGEQFYEEFIKAFMGKLENVSLLKGMNSANEMRAAAGVRLEDSKEFLKSDGHEKINASDEALKKDFKRRESENPELLKNADYLNKKASALADQLQATTNIELGKLLAASKHPEEWDKSSVLSKEQKEVKKYEKDFGEKTESTVKGIAESKELGKVMADNIAKLKESASLQAMGGGSRAKADKDIADAEKALQQMLDNTKGQEEKYAQLVKEAEDEKSKLLKTALDHQVAAWKNSMDEITSLKSKWGGAIMTDLEKLVQGRNANGTKMNNKQRGNMVRGTLAGMATDTSNMLLHRATAPLVGGAADALGNGAMNLFGLNRESGVGGALSSMFGLGGKTGKPDGTATNPIVTVQGTGVGSAVANAATAPSGMLATALTKVKDVASGLWGSLTGTKGAADGLTSAVGNTVAKTASELTGITAKMTAEQTATLSLTNLATAASMAATSMAGGGGGGGIGGLLGGFIGGGASGAAAGASAGLTAGTNVGVMGNLSASAMFANGGIMTNFGPVELKKYAMGGIANSPQLALYGEAGPEAYVPLPDGRSIPVTMKGAGATSSSRQQGSGQTVNISVVVNQAASGSPTSATSSTPGANTSTQMNNLANNLSGLVRQEIIAQSRPGGLLYK
jgi:hypothetical protein